MTTPEITLSESGVLVKLPAPVPGPPGLSAYQMAVAAGFLGTEPEWRVSLQGATGPAGMGSSVPGGRPTLVSGQPEMAQTADYSSTVLYYAPFMAPTVPRFNGTDWEALTFTAGPFDQIGLSLSGGSKWAANSKHDGFVVKTGGAARLGTGPAWSNDSFTSRNLVRRDGIWVNAAAITLDLSETESVVIPANQATWVASINVGATAGVLTATYTQGQNRRCDVWSVYHQKEIVLKVGHPCPTTTDITRWIPNTQYPTWKAYNNDLSNKGCAFTGMPTKRETRYIQRSFLNSVSPNGLCAAVNAICKDSIATLAQRGTWGSFNTDAYGVLMGVSAEAAFDDCSEVGEHWYYMGTANANAMSTVTMLGMPNPAHSNMAGRNTEDGHCLTIKYLG